MTSTKDKILADLQSDSLTARRWAAMEVGGLGCEGADLLPLLLDRISKNLGDLPSGAMEMFITVGRVLCAIDGEPTEDLIAKREATIDRVIELLREAKGESASMLIYILVLTGLPAQRASSTVLEAALRGEEVRLKYRAFQYAIATNPLLLNDLPWKDFIPPDEKEREEWRNGAFGFTE